MAFLAEQRPRTVGKAVAPKPGLNTEVISPDGSRFDLTGPHRCLGRGGRASPEGQNCHVTSGFEDRNTIILLNSGIVGTGTSEELKYRAKST
uniref:Uncharacterized protein n=1 Tax=Trichuris muris TaxID=70415 RepID=A0A5S6Q9F8_TRIMR